MRELFISYAREDQPDVGKLFWDLAVLGYETTTGVYGGTWDDVLRRIANCDVFVAIVSGHTLNSVACKQALEWALALNKPVLPVAVERLPEALPRALSMRQIVDYSKPDRKALTGALATLPPAPPPPEPLPEPPPAPLSYLLPDLAKQVGEPEPLTHEQQHQILIQLEPALRSADAEERRGRRHVLDVFSRRDDLYADVDRTLAQFGIARREAQISQPLPAPKHPGEFVLAGEASSGLGARDAGARLSSSVFAPPVVEPGAVFLVQVFAHLPDQEAQVARLARDFDDEAKRRATVPFESPVFEGERLAFELLLPGLLVDDPVQSMVWIGGPQSVQFGVTVPPHFSPRTVIGTVMISRDSVPIGHLKFKLNVREPGAIPSRVAELAVTHGMHCYRRAFISYASADRKEVLKRAQMLASVGIEFFQDILTLEPGEHWERRIYNEIDLCDLFLLFWSSAARTSPWVLKEVHYALKLNGGNELVPPEILPVIIEGPPPVPPPPELAHLHFNDRILYFIHPKRTSWFAKLLRRGR
jgi:hypothetical protein